MHRNSYWMSFKEKKKPLFFSWSVKKKSMKLKKNNNDIERNSTKFYQNQTKYLLTENVPIKE